MDKVTKANYQPRVWLVLSDKGGDNRQVEIIARGLGWACERKCFRMRPDYVKGKPPIRASLHHIDRAASDPLEPPWPDLIMTIGRRAAMVALWIRQQTAGRTKIVLIGKPHGRLEPYDLIVASLAENALPPLPNVLPIALPLMRVDPEALSEAAEFWRPQLSDLPRPLIGVLVGGPNIHFRSTDVLVPGRRSEHSFPLHGCAGRPFA
jgi:mitochondrial fission protein ELM1